MALPTIDLPIGFVRTPSTAKQATLDNYVSSIDLHKDDIYDQLINRYGPQRITEDLWAVHGDMRPVKQTEFSHFEEEWIHEEAEITATVGTDQVAALATVSAPYLTVAAGPPASPSNGKTSLRVGDVILLNTGQTALVTETSDAHRSTVHGTLSPADNQVAIVPYQDWTTDSQTALGAGTNVAVVSRENVEFGKMGDEFLTPNVFKYSNTCQIIDETYAASGTEMTNQIWINVRGVNGKSGYLWYYRGELDARNRFENYAEVQMLVGEQAANGGTLANSGHRGTRGYLNDLEAYSGRFEDNFATNNVTTDDLRTMVKHLNKYRGARENAMYMGIDLSNQIEKAVASDVAYFSGGQNFGAFNNSESTFVNLGFSSLKISNYRFAFKTFDLFNHPKLLGAPGMDYTWWGMVVPLDSVPDAKSGDMLPSLSVRYKAMEGYSREMEHFLTGGANGIYTERTDGVYFNYRTERAFEGCALNRHFLFKNM